MSNISFIKMHGLGNDFVILDSRNFPINLNKNDVKHICNRHKGIGCDQLIIIAKSTKADCAMIIYNQDASHSSTCGNATRCVAQLLMKEIGKGKVTIETSSGTLIAQSEANRYISVDMGEPIFAWQQIPLAREDYASEFKFDSISSPFVVNMGNPHIVFVVSNVNLIKLAELGPQIEHHELFPQKVNVNFAEIVNPQIIKLRVWERGSGETLACGSGACATLVALAKQNLTERQATICLPGGDLQIKWLANNHVIMCGEAEVSFTGNIII